jgi:hypothetical protein
MDQFYRFRVRNGDAFVDFLLVEHGRVLEAFAGQER